MSIQQGINQILGMALIGGKLSGIQEARENKKLANTIQSIDTEVSGRVDPLSKRSKDAFSKQWEDPSVKNATASKMADAEYAREIEATEGLRGEAQKLRTELMLRDPTKENIEAVIAGEKAIERAKREVQHSILRRKNMNEFIAANAYKHNETGGTDDGK